MGSAGDDLTEEKAHSVFGASSSARWMNCPGSIALIEKAPAQAESKYAAEGTKAHACLEFLMEHRPGASLADRIALANVKFKDPAMVQHAVDAMNVIYFMAGEGTEVLSERQVDASSFTCEGQFGTLDAAIVDEFATLTVIDYKYGAGVAVDPAGEGGLGNSQLVYYALATSEMYHHNFADVELVVIQPRAFHEDGPVRRFKLTMQQLLDWIPRFKAGVERAKQPGAPLKAGSWCKFCPAGVICPELKGASMREAQVVFSDVGGLEAVPEVKMIQIPHLGTILAACDKLELWIEKVRTHALHVAERGRPVAGYKLVKRKATKKWIDEEAIAVEARREFGDDAFSAPKLLSPAQLRKACDAFPGGKGNDNWLHEWVEQRVKQVSSGMVLVPDSDRRSGIRPIDEIFGEVEVAHPTALMGRIPKTKTRKKK